MVRNSCDHGLEKPEDRLASGKSDTGTVTLSARHEGGYIIIEISDDGRGINIERVKQKAVENGLTSPEQLSLMAEEQILQFIFRAGFSTAEKVTSVSGRGVGMDVVRTNIEKIGGAVELRSKVGKGSTFDIKIPLTLAIVSVLIVESRGRCFAIPQLNVAELVSVAEDSDYKLEEIHGARVLRLREKLLPMLSLAEVLGLPAQDGAEDEAYVAVIKVGASEFGLLVHRVHDTEEIVVKPTSRVLEHLAVYAGNTILGDGSVIMILDPNGLAKALGDHEGAGKHAAAVENTQRVRSTSYLVFTAGGDAQKAVPLELVSRLEEIDTTKIEYSGGEPVVQYRGDLMQLRCLDNTAIPGSGAVNIIVFTYDSRSIGLVVERIVDIVQAPVDIQLVSENPLYLGGMIIGDKTTDVLSIAHLIQTTLHTRAGETQASIEGLESLHVLYVEDSPFFRNLTVNYFKTLGLAMHAAASGAEALAFLSNAVEPFDLIVTDIEMPEMDGFEFAKAARKIGAHAQCPIYAFTSTVNHEVQQKVAECGLSGVVNKTNREALVEIMRSLATQSRKAA